MWFIIAFLFILFVAFKEPIYKFVMKVPKREPDYSSGHWDFWFDEMVCYSYVLVRKGKLTLMTHPRHKELRAMKITFGSNVLFAPREAQEAYLNHMDTSFEKQVLDVKDT